MRFIPDNEQHPVVDVRERKLSHWIPLSFVCSLSVTIWCQGKPDPVKLGDRDRGVSAGVPSFLGLWPKYATATDATNLSSYTSAERLYQSKAKEGGSREEVASLKCNS